MKTKVFIASLMVLLAVALFSCGGGGGVSGSDSGGTNISIDSVSVTSETNHDIDVFADALTRSDAVIAIGVSKINPSINLSSANVTKCRISYSPKDAGAPSIAQMITNPACTIVEGDNDCLVALIDIQRKAQFYADINDGAHNNVPVPTHYVAEYDCEFTNSGGNGDFPAKYDIWLADFVGPVPTLSIFPDAATILANGGAATFLIRGGVPPYQISSDNDNLASLTPDFQTGSFTVTGRNNGTGTVTITVSDNASQEATVTVTLQ